MRNKMQAGFTIIEVMIVLGALGLLSTVGYVMYGNANEKINLNGAAQTVANQMDQICTSSAIYLQFEGKTLDSSDWEDKLAETATAKNIPIPNKKAQDDDFSGTFEYTLDDSSYANFGEDDVTDTVLLLRGVSDNVCMKINELYTALGKDNSWKTIPSAPNYSENKQCFSSGGSNVTLEVMFYDN